MNFSINTYRQEKKINGASPSIIFIYIKAIDYLLKLLSINTPKNISDAGA